MSPVGLEWRVRHPNDVADRLVSQLAGVEHEELHVLLLDVKCAVIDQIRVYRGHVSGAPVRIGEIFREAVARQASGIIVCHNHPSGDPSASDADLELTREAAQAGALLDIALIDHVIVAGTQFVSLREVGLLTDLGPRPHRVGEPRPAWRDPDVSLYKSALQKYIRRGEIEKAARAAWSLGTRPGGRVALSRRLPVIAAEDVGFEWLAAVGEAVRATEGTPTREAVGLMAQMAGSLASVPKSKEAYWLAATCWEGRRTPHSKSPEALATALAEGRHQDAAAICLDARTRRSWRSGPRLIDALTQAMVDGPDAARRMAEWALWRERSGGSGADELVAAAVLAAIDRPTDCPDLVLVPVRVGGLERVDWYTQDAHTPVGRVALARSARMLGVPTAVLANLMFNVESIRLGPWELPARWKDEALALDAVAGGWDTHERGVRIWESVQAIVRREIESVLDRSAARHG